MIKKYLQTLSEFYSALPKLCSFHWVIRQDFQDLNDDGTVSFILNYKYLYNCSNMSNSSGWLIIPPTLYYY